MKAIFGIERELENKLHVIEYEIGNGDFHFHSQIELCFVEEGEIDAVINNKTKKIKVGDVSIALGFDTHAYRPSGYARFTVLVIPLNICEKFTSAISKKQISDPFICDKAVTSRLKEYLSELKKETTNEIEKLGYVYLILGVVLNNLNFDTSDKYAETQLISKLLLYIHDNYNKNLTLSSIAAEFGYNASYISRYFKSSINIGISQYINLIRLKNAIELMRKKKHSITYCALESGFPSLRTFYRIFQNEFKQSPKEYLEKVCLF